MRLCFHALASNAPPSSPVSARPALVRALRGLLATALAATTSCSLDPAGTGNAGAAGPGVSFRQVGSALEAGAPRTAAVVDDASAPDGSADGRDADSGGAQVDPPGPDASSGAGGGAEASAPARSEPAAVADAATRSAYEGPWFTLAAGGEAQPILLDDEDFTGVAKVAAVLASDIESASGAKPELISDWPERGSPVVAGTLGKSRFIDDLVARGKLDVEDVSGKWETFVIALVSDPVPGVHEALVIAGSDKRGTLFGLLEVSRRFGVSPWVYWADVPTAEQDPLRVRAERHTLGAPAVKYRGIFINDEDPALNGWVSETFGGFNADFYESVFVLLLRLKANYLWPAQWGKAFALDDSRNLRRADEFGIVIGTSHHEPMLRTQEEWNRMGGTDAQWNYEQADDIERLHDFWREGITRSKGDELLVTVGMRGNGDKPLSSERDVDLLQQVVKDQRAIIEDVTGKPASETPQLWALYKEVLEYFDQGMEVPDDVTLMFTDDNFGNLRRLPILGSEPRPGGYGIYTHFDYVGGPRSYKWLNTNPIARVWEQMHLAYAYGADRIWLVNVGDLKPMELPIQFFLDFAYSPEKWGKDDLRAYHELWATEQFGAQHAAEIAELLALYTKYNGRRKPELLDASTYSQQNFQEAERVVADYNSLARRAEALYDELPKAHRDAYFQLVLYPIKACANVNELHFRVGQNRLYARQMRAATNATADRVQELFERDADYTYYFNEVMTAGKWAHMMDQPKIGYDGWQGPEAEVMPQVERLVPLDAPALGVAIEGATGAFLGTDEQAPELALTMHRYQPQTERYIEVYNRGQGEFPVELASGDDWVILRQEEGVVADAQRVWVSIDWARAPLGTSESWVGASGAGDAARVSVIATNPQGEVPAARHVEANGYLAFAASDADRAVESGEVGWVRLPDHGRTGDGMTPYPVTASEQAPGGDGPRLEYDVHLFGAGDVRVISYTSPTQQLQGHPVRFAVSFDDQEPIVVSPNPSDNLQTWESMVRDNAQKLTTTHTLSQAGPHTLKIWMVDPGIVLQKIVIDIDGVPASYLGPPTEPYVPPIIDDVGPLAIGAKGGANGEDGIPPDEPGAVPAALDGGASPASIGGLYATDAGCACALGKRRTGGGAWALLWLIGAYWARRRVRTAWD